MTPLSVFIPIELMAPGSRPILTIIGLSFPRRNTLFGHSSVIIHRCTASRKTYCNRRTQEYKCQTRRRPLTVPGAYIIAPPQPPSILVSSPHSLFAFLADFNDVAIVWCRHRRGLPLRFSFPQKPPDRLPVYTPWFHSNSIRASPWSALVFDSGNTIPHHTELPESWEGYVMIHYAQPESEDCYGRERRAPSGLEELQRHLVVTVRKSSDTSPKKAALPIPLHPLLHTVNLQPGQLSKAVSCVFISDKILGNLARTYFSISSYSCGVNVPVSVSRKFSVRDFSMHIGWPCRWKRVLILLFSSLVLFRLMEMVACPNSGS
ncbi:hypothetical protein P691DRAFT_191295 [Macrolepiota fuliginosa MF-IS2]|uniref:Uncharacterized protein n=1 Tax=Macrolepiota fuliginosa MF-IS2 TaxID=1400762 RepID=A0A9P5XSP6_9AGAR|nr:hypothetical protein P691DRAFT_191295 [Macrolepiota fuliginosa MF-IS2]